MPFRVGLVPDTDRCVIPQAYGITGIFLTNFSGETIDIQDIVVRFSITESLYAHGLILRLDLKDSANLIEQYKLVGQERIRVQLSKTPFFEDEGTGLELTFSVSEYPIYGKDPMQPNVQVYTIVALSPHIFTNKLTWVSRSFSNISSEISKILRQDLNVSPTRIGVIETPKNLLKGIIPFMRPLEAAAWVTENSYGINRDPFFLFENLKGIHFVPYSRLIAAKPYRHFTDSKLSRAEAQTKESFKEEQGRIISMSSDYRVSKLVGAIGGSYAAKNSFVDIGTKSISTESFSNKSFNFKALSLNGNSSMASKWNSEKNLPLNESYDSFTRMYPDNTTNGSAFYVTAAKGQNAATASAVKQNLDQYVHTVTVPGDFNLTSGVVIQLDILKAIDQAEFTKSDSWSYDDVFDLVLSGKYLITSVIHEFADVHKSILTIKKDSLLNPL